MKRIVLAATTAAALLASCSEYSTKPYSFVLPSSNKNIDIVQHRSDVRFSDCGTLTVLQTYNGEGQLIDAKEARGQALHCTLLPALIDAGGRVGAGAVVRPARTTISNAVNAAAGASATSGSNASATATGGNATATGGAGGAGGAGGNGGNGGQGGGNNGDTGSHGNNGGGNGDGDGTNPGSDHHHDNGDNS